jgi:hypothetical protein
MDKEVAHSVQKPITQCKKGKPWDLEDKIKIGCLLVVGL